MSKQDRLRGGRRTRRAASSTRRARSACAVIDEDELQRLLEGLKMYAIIGGSGLAKLSALESHAAAGDAHALRRAVGRADLRPARRPRGGLPGAARLRPHDRRRTRSTTAPTSGR
ncbi:MAG: hypothetical protein MZW92_38975 [Comamonadaceae bacterium]|nr:hypothetical protein [Comamonadaceae bacterium]